MGSGREGSKTLSGRRNSYSRREWPHQLNARKPSQRLSKQEQEKMETNWRREQSAEAETYQDALSESEKKVGLLASKLSIAAANRMADDEMNSNNEKIVMTKRKKNLHRLE